MRKVAVVPHDPTWRDAFDRESTRIAAAFGPNLIAIHHIGSTSIAGIYAKPIIDILVAVAEIAQVDDRTLQMQALGYACLGEFGISGRRFFRKDNAAGNRTHHLHTFAVESPQVSRHLAFRDYLNAHPAAAQQYSHLKQALAQQYSADLQAYLDGKDEFIKAIDRAASQWQR